MEEWLEGMVEARKSLGTYEWWWVYVSDGIDMDWQGYVLG